MIAIRLFLVLVCLAASAKELRFSIRSEPRTLDPLQVSDQASEAVRYLTTARLVRLHPKTGRVEPELAVSWSVRNGNRTLAFRIRGGVRFSDGTPFAAADVVRTVQALLDPQKKLAAGEELRTLPIQSVSVQGGDSVEIRFREPLASPELFFAEVPITAPFLGPNPGPGLGPFVLDSYQRGRQLRFRRNPHYWKTVGSERLPRLDSVLIEIIPNADLERAAWQAGRLHLLEAVDAALFDELAASGAARDNGPSPEAEVLWFNLNPDAPIAPAKKKWFAAREFRQAISALIRREDLVRIAFRQRGTPASGPFAPGSAWLRPAAKSAPVRDVGAILRQLAPLGFRRDSEGLLRDAQGEQVSFSIATNSSNRTRVQMLSLLQADLARAGITVAVAPLDMPSLLERMAKTKQYDAILLGLIGVDDDPNHQMNIWLSSSVNHPWQPSQATPATPWERELDDLLRRQFQTPSVSERKKLIWRMQEIIEEMRPVIYLVHPHVLSAVSPRLRNADPSVRRPRVFWNIDSLDVADGAGR